MVQVYVLRDQERLGHLDADLHARLPDERKLHLVLVAVQKQHGHLVPDIVQGLHEHIAGGRNGDEGCKKSTTNLSGYTCLKNKGFQNFSLFFFQCVKFQRKKSLIHVCKKVIKH